MAIVVRRPRIGDTSTVVKLDMGEALAGATGLKVKYLKADGITDGEVDGSIVETTKIEATLPALDQEGDWVLVPYTADFDGWVGHGDAVNFHVFGIFEVAE